MRVRVCFLGWVAAVLVLGGLSVSSATAANCPLTVTGSVSSGPNPSTAMVNETVTMSLSSSEQGPTHQQESHITSKSWVWNIASVERRDTPTGSWTPAIDGVDYTAQLAPSTSSSPGTVLTAQFKSAAYWRMNLSVSVGFEDDQNNTWSGQDTMTVNLVAGEWVRQVPDEKQPEPVGPNDSGPGEQTVNVYELYGSTTVPKAYLKWSFHRSSNWNKAWIWGERVWSWIDTGSGLGGWINKKPSLPVTNLGLPESKWQATWKWVPNGSSPRSTFFKYRVKAKMSWQAEGHVSNGHIDWDGHGGYGYSAAFGRITVLAWPNGNKSEEKLNLIYERNEDSTITASVSYPFSVGISWEQGPDNDWVAKHTMNAWQDMVGAVTSGSSGSVVIEVTMNTQVQIAWDNEAEGAFQAGVDTEIYSISLEKVDAP